MTVKLKAPEGFTDVSFGSQSYAADENGIVEVPSEAAEFLYQFGFGNVASEPAEGLKKPSAGVNLKPGSRQDNPNLPKLPNLPKPKLPNLPKQKPNLPKPKRLNNDGRPGIA